MQKPREYADALKERCCEEIKEVPTKFSESSIKPDPLADICDAMVQLPNFKTWELINGARQIADRAIAHSDDFKKLFYKPGNPRFLSIEDRVRKIGGSYQATGTIKAVFAADDGSPRYVFRFDNPPGLLHIFSGNNLERIAADED
jgi:hypothetical protein